MQSVELLAPAGDRDSAFAAFHYGADAVYAGLRKFSARAEAVNLTAGELGEVTAFAHAASPRRRVYVTVNTLVLDGEIEELIDALAAVADLGADGVIVQDLGALRLCRMYFPGLPVHASTQMGIHNLAGAETLRDLGVRRVTLARELTTDEVRDIAARSGIEVEVFVHGALCYSYSGLCLYSSLLRGRSGNRGRCQYPCRDAFTPATGGTSGFPFSMKDLARPGEIDALRGAGVTSLKIEGRKKSALYVAVATDYYRRCLDGTMTPAARKEAEENIKTVFSRPWTSLYSKSRRNRDVCDTAIVGHRGAPVGTVEAVLRKERGDWLKFKPGRRIEVHDGLQIDVAGESRPFGFAVETIRLSMGRGKTGKVFEAPPHSTVEVPLPPDHPAIEVGAALYCASSQAVKQKYRAPTPKPGAYRVRRPVAVEVSVRADRLSATGRVGEAAPPVIATAAVEGVFTPSRQPDLAENAARAAFEKLGDTGFELASFAMDNPGNLFVPVSLLNRLRRELTAGMEQAAADERARRIDAIKVAEGGVPAATGAAPGPVEWALKTDRLAHLDALTEAELAAAAELSVEIGLDPVSDVAKRLEELGAVMGRDRIRLAIPMLVRQWETEAMEAAVRRLADAGWLRWDVSNLGGWGLLRRCGIWERVQDVEADWPVYVSNRCAARQVLGMGARRVTVSPEDTFANIRRMLAGFGDRTSVIVYQDTPLFVSETCAMANVAGRCSPDGSCRGGDLNLESGSGEAVTLIQRQCRSYVVSRAPYSLAGRLGDLCGAGARRFRADFILVQYHPEDVRRIWNDLRQGVVVQGMEGNFTRGSP